MLVIGRIDENRWVEARDLRLEALQKEPLAFGGSYEEEILLSENEWKKRLLNTFFIQLDTLLIGQIVVTFSNRIKTKHIAYLYGVYLKEQYRGQGLGKMMMNEAMRVILDNSNISKIELEVNSINRVAVKLYESFGFKVIGKRTNAIQVDGLFYDELLMEKML
jgi:ribosomal protein S18 acetylase RimI-like enzyme